MKIIMPDTMYIKMLLAHVEKMRVIKIFIDILKGVEPNENVPESF